MAADCATVARKKQRVLNFMFVFVFNGVEGLL